MDISVSCFHTFARASTAIGADGEAAPSGLSKMPFEVVQGSGSLSKEVVAGF